VAGCAAFALSFAGMYFGSLLGRSLGAAGTSPTATGAAREETSCE
jgi:hypothetical protein